MAQMKYPNIPLHTVLAVLLTISPALADIGIISPGEVPAGSSFDVKWKTAEVPNGGSISVTAEGGSKIRASYAYIAPPPKEEKVLAEHPLKVGGTMASLTAPGTATAGSEVIVSWEGPNNTGNNIIIRDQKGKRVSATGYAAHRESHTAKSDPAEKLEEALEMLRNF